MNSCAIYRKSGICLANTLTFLSRLCLAVATRGVVLDIADAAYRCKQGPRGSQGLGAFRAQHAREGPSLHAFQ